MSRFEAELSELLTALRAAGVSFRDRGDLCGGWRDRPPADLTPGLPLLMAFVTSGAPALVRAEVVMWFENPSASSLDEWLFQCLLHRRLDGPPGERAADLVGRRSLRDDTLQKFIAYVADRSQPVALRRYLLDSTTKHRRFARREDVRRLVIGAAQELDLAYQTLPVVERLGIVLPIETLRLHLDHPEASARRSSSPEGSRANRSVRRSDRD